ncbi:HIT domain-containing protein [candidate division KSB1 bacterium]
MDKIWAPWRSPYLKHLGNRTEEEAGCVLCKIPETADEERYILKRGESCYVVLNLYPYNNGHLMVVPYRHIPSLTELTPEEGAELLELTSESIRALQSGLKPDAFNMGANLGRLAGAGIVDHFHMHVVPRWGGDTNFFPVIGETKVISAPLEETYAKLRPHFQG